MLSVLFANLLQQHILGVLVWDVSYHEAGSAAGLDLNVRGVTFSGIMRYSWAYSQETILFFLGDSFRWYWGLDWL